MGKNGFRLIFFLNLLVLCFFLFVSNSFAATLSWSPVPSTESCVIEGYKIHYGTTSSQYDHVLDVGDVTSYNLDLIDLVPSQTYYFAISAYSTTGLDGPSSSPVSYTDSPNIVSYPIVDHSNGTIDVTYNEKDMLGAAVKSNYLFSPTISFDPDREILQMEKTYRLYMSYIPAYTIITMGVSNVTDSKGNALLSGSIVLNDDDNDKMADDWETFYGVNSAFGDEDSDGLENSLEYISGTSPIDDDSDDDDMDDGWEFENDLDPVVDDADEEKDGDGISNLDEYKEGTEVLNSGPEKPVLREPGNGSLDVSLKPQLKTNAYEDNESDLHLKTQWQISTENTFTISEKILFELESYEALTILPVPEFVLDPDQTYFWRVRFFDVLNGRSFWSEPFSFKTKIINSEDIDKDGVPDNIEIVDGIIDLNLDGSFDAASDRYKLVSFGTLSIALEGSSNVSSVVCLKTINPDEIPDPYGKPTNLDYGLIQFKLEVDNPGDTADVIFYFSEPVGNQWYKYDLKNRWSEYSKDYPGYVQFAPDGRSVRLRLIDGGAGDSDGVANGIIVDPSGPGGIVAAATGSSVAAGSGGGDSGGDSGGGGGCFIATAAFGSPVERHVQVLKDFRDSYLLKFQAGRAFVKAYYKYSPPVADIIAGNEKLKSVVRIGLMPLIALGYFLVYMSFVQQGILILGALILGVLSWIYIRKFFSIFVLKAQ